MSNTFLFNVCLFFSANVFSGGTCWCLLGLSSRVFNIFLVNSTNVCLKCLPLLVFQCLLVGHLVSCWEGQQELLMSVAQCFQTVLSTGTEVFLLLCITLLSESFSISDGVGVHSSSVSVGCQLDVFSVSFTILFQNLSDLLLIFPHTKFLSRLYKCIHL